MDKTLLDWLLEHHRESYRYQLEQSDKVITRISVWSSPLTLFGGAILYLWTHFPMHQSGWRPIVFYLSIAIATLWFMKGVAFMLLTLLPRKYSSILSPRNLQAYVTELSKNQTVDVLTKTKEHLLNRYCDAATLNSDINESRNSNLLIGARACLYALIFFLAALFPFMDSTPVQNAQRKGETTEMTSTDK